MPRPVNPYRRRGVAPLILPYADALAAGFEEGVNAGMEVKDEEQHEQIQSLLALCTKEMSRLKGHPLHSSQVNTLLWVVAQIYHIFGEEQGVIPDEAVEALL